jgi:hypothetical protein
MATTDLQTIVPSHMQSVPGSVNIPIARFPPASKSAVPDADKAASDLVDTFNKALKQHDYQAISHLFLEDGFWRDHLALSWDFHTVKGPKKVLGFLKDCEGSRDGFRLKNIAIDRTSNVRAPQVAPVDGAGEVPAVQFFFKLETVIGWGEGIARLVEQDGNWKIFTLYTSLRQLKGHEEEIYDRRAKGVEHGGQPGRKNWAERRTAESNYDEGREPAVLIVGRSFSLNSQALLISFPRRGSGWSDSRCKIKDARR